MGVAVVFNQCGVEFRIVQCACHTIIAVIHGVTNVISGQLLWEERGQGKEDLHTCMTSFRIWHAFASKIRAPQPSTNYMVVTIYVSVIILNTYYWVLRST